MTFKVSYSSNASFIEGLCKAYAQIAIASAVSSVGKAQVRAQLQPSRKIVADKDFAKGALKLVFETSKIAILKTKPDGRAGKALPIIVPPMDSSDRFVYVTSSNSASQFAPAWHARVAVAPEVGNASVSFLSIDVGTPSDTLAIKVPLLTNSEPIAFGEEIVIDSNAAIDAWAKAMKRAVAKAEPKKVPKQPRAST